MIPYSQNIFKISDPEEIFQFIAQIGFLNTKFIKTLHIWVPWMATLSPWLQLFYVLSKEATRLRSIKLGWGANCDYLWHLERGAMERGLGDNLDFVRALGMIQGLEKLIIKGYYAKNWPIYLEERMGTPVRAICGHYREGRELKGDMNDKELEDQKFLCEMNERELKTFRSYQQGTEDLIP
ncbi:hypothetical protein G7Y89_g540 [Cudoniella acicularis]|uniref:Uncharacterized protein n=1 Tax=Cudoniella acicularis TaxID=354080 RepID=A0A8H4W7V1_9HELO|nr:hypothetical protein G7Y89_g540 [Cudoniella acicularis]